MSDCLFCRIGSGEVPSAKVYEDEHTVGFLDILPANKGHCLIIPKEHSENLLETNEDTLSQLIIATKKVAKAMSLSIGNNSYNIVQNNGKDAGQVVNHIHFHLIPRFENDGLRIKWSHKKYVGDEINQIAEKIKKFL